MTTYATELVVLVLDDDPFMRKAIGREIEREFPCVEAGTFDDAIAFLGLDRRICAVVSDSDLGLGPSGEEFLTVVRSRLPAAARILVSGSPLTEEARDRMLSAGIAHHIVAKPWRPGVVRALIRSELLARGVRHRGS